MKNKILITGCTFTVIALLSIQAYFIYNTYQLKENELTAQVKKVLEKLDDRENNARNDSIYRIQQEIIVDFSNGKINKSELVANLKKAEAFYAKIAINYINGKFKKTNYEIGFSKNIKSIIIKNKNRNDTIFNQDTSLFHTQEKLKYKHILNTGTWSSSGSIKTKKDGKLAEEHQYAFEVIRVSYYCINNLKQLIFSEMIGLLLASFFLMSFVILLFYISIKNGIKQKKIAEMQRDFINNITHEFKTPLATLSIATKTLNATILDEEMQKNTVAIIERQNNRLQNIVNQVNFDSLLLNISTLKLEQNINQEAIGNCITDFQVAHPAIEIFSQLNTSNIDLKMSKFHFNTLLVNLLENAVKYGGTQITITTKSVVNAFILSIRDNGIGIHKNDQNAVFDKFYRIQNGDIHNTKGLGLGLFYAREIIESYQGKITIESQQNKGATFIISIPI
ncbi:sensor histidine kinase [Flavobacterium sp. ZB4P13]|uniref:sensor histidine kinase n=1 Tax=Flavobacterium sp. ZB4P13 TaxID=3401728 RepID=UPI003AAF9DC7